MTDLTRAVVAVDVGTSAVRAALVSADRGVIRSTRVVRRESVGGATYDADALQSDVESAIAMLEVDGRPAALAIAAHIGAVAVDDALRPVVEAGSWSDARGVDVLAALPEEARARILSGSGRPVLTGGGLALAATLLDPAVAGRVHAMLSPKDLLVARLTGHLGTDTVDAAYTLALDVADRTWSDAADAVGVPRAWLPPLAAPDAPVATLDARAAARCRLSEGTAVVAGAPDGSAGIAILLGSRTDAIADVAGTTDVLGRLLDRAADAPAGAVCNPALEPGGWVAGGATGMTGGSVARWRQLVGAVEESDVAAVPPGARGLRIVPSMSGSRFPRWRAGDLGAVLGQSPTHGPAEILRAAQEGASHVVREGVDVLDPTGGVPVILAGGSTRSAHVVRMRAAMLARRVLVASEPDVTLAGAAGLALVGAGLVSSLDDARDRLAITLTPIEPDAGDVERYQQEHIAWRASRDAMTS